MKSRTRKLIGQIKSARSFGLGMVKGHGKKQKRKALADSYKGRGLKTTRAHIKKMY